MSLLSTIRESLFLNQEVYVRESRPFRYFPPSVRGYVEMHYMHTSPMHGLYTTSELQCFMLSLLPFQPAEATSFQMSNTNEMQFGCLTYNEIVGRCNEQHWKTLDIDTPDVLVPDNFKNELQRTDTGVITTDLKRRTSVYVYPDPGYMYDCEGKLTFANKAYKVRPRSERPLNSHKDEALTDSAWFP